MVLAMLQQALTPLAEVTTATDAADALLKAVDDTPDLLVCDYKMPGMDGRQLVEKLKSRPATANFSTVLMASKVDIAERLSPVDAADDYLEKPFFLKDATRRIKRTIDRIALEKMAKTAPKDGVVRGSLAQMNVIDLMQSLEMGRKSCQLSLSNEGDKCEVFFVEGQVKHATYGALGRRRGRVQSAALDGREFPARLRRQDRQRDDATQYPGTVDGRLAVARRILARWRRRTGTRSCGGRTCPCASRRVLLPVRSPRRRGKKRKMSSSMAETHRNHGCRGNGQRFLRARGTRGFIGSGGGASSSEASLPDCRPRGCSGRLHSNSESADSPGARGAVRRDDRRNWDRCTRRDAGGHPCGMRSALGRSGGADAQRGEQEDSVCGAEPRGVRSAREGADSESAGESCRGSRVSAGCCRN